MNDNAIIAKFYKRSTMAELPDPLRDGLRVSVDRAGSIYPGGWGAAEITIERDPAAPLPFTGGDVMRLYNGPSVVYEGVIGSPAFYMSPTGAGVRVSATGPWGAYLGRRSIDKRWADCRITGDVWVDATPTGFSDNNRDRFTVDRNGRLRVDTKAATLANLDGRSLTYSQPTGQTTKRVKHSYNYQEAALNMGWRLYSVTGAANVFNIVASGSGTRDDTLGTPSQHVFLTLYSNAAQAAPGDGSVFGQIDDAVSGATRLMVYSELGNINAYEVFRDIRAMVSELSVDERLIDTTATVSIEPFITEGREALSSILARIAGFGSAGYGAYGYGVWDGSSASDGLPMLFLEPWPSIADYDYEVRLRDLSGGSDVVVDHDAVINWVTVEYGDPDGKTHTLTPDDDATLKDAASITQYGERHLPGPLRVGQIGKDSATQYARTYLARAKTPRVYVSDGITLQGYAKRKNGQRVPVSRIKAGERVKFIDYLVDSLGVSGAGLTSVITAANYTDRNGGEMALQFGQSDDLAGLLAQTELAKTAPVYHSPADGAAPKV